MTDIVESPPDTSYSSWVDRTPSYMLAANAHSIASDSWSLGDYGKAGAGAAAGAVAGSFFPVPILGTVGGALIGGIAGAATAVTDGKWAAASLASGALSFWNTGVMVSNWLGGDNQQLETSKVLAQYDTDLAKYYQANKESADIGGFLAGSLLPTILSLRVYNYAAGVLTGAKLATYGDTYAGITGLTAPLQARYLSAAARELTTATNPQIALNANYLKAFTLGVGEEALQGGVATIATLASMKASPILTDMDVYDMGKNVLEGALVGGVIGGALRGAVAFGSVKKSFLAFEQEARPFVHREQLADAAKANDNLVQAFADKFRIQELKPTGENADVLQIKQTKTLNSINNDIHSYSRELAGKDDTVGNVFANTLSQLPTFDSVAAHTHGVVAIKRLSEVSAIEQKLATLQKDTKVREALMTAMDLGPLRESAYARLAKLETKLADPANVDILASFQVTTLKAWGEQFGEEVAGTMIAAPSLADTLKAGQSIKVSENGLSAGSRSWNFKVGEAVDLASTPLQELQARQIWALNKELTFGKDLVIDSTDLPLLKAAYEQFRDGVSTPFAIRLPGGMELQVNARADILDRITGTVAATVREQKVWREVALEEGTKSPNVLSNPELAARMDIRNGYLEGTAINEASPLSDLFALRSASLEHSQRMEAAGKWDIKSKGLIPVWEQPQHIKLISDVRETLMQNGFIAEGTALLTAKQRLFQTTADNAFGAVVGPELTALVPDTTSVIESARAASALTSTQGMVTAANGSYGSWTSIVQQVGSVTAKIRNQFKKHTSEGLASSVATLANRGDIAAEFAVVNNLARAKGEAMYLIETAPGEFALGNSAARNAASTGDAITEELIKVSADLVPILKDHIAINGVRTANRKTLIAANGQSSHIDSESFYPLPPNPRDYPFFAFVVDDTPTATRRTSMLYAADEQALDKLIQETQKANLGFSVTGKNTQIKTMTKREVERFYEAQGSFSADDVISENYIDIALKRSGISSNYLPNTAKESVTKNFTDWHLKQDDLLARYAVETKYSQIFNEMHKLAESVTDVATSKAGFLSEAKYADSRVSNPFQNYIRTALDITDTASTPLWTAANNLADKQFSKLWDSARSVFQNEKDPEIGLQKLAAIYTNAGYNSPFKSTEQLLAANHTASGGVLSNFVSRMNGLFATLQLRLDPMAALTNKVSSVITAAPEMRAVIAGIQRGDASAVGKLAMIEVPGTGDKIFSPLKAYANAQLKIFDPAEREWAKANGFFSKHLQEYQAIIDMATLTGKESSRELSEIPLRAYNKMMQIGDIGEKLTGNSLAESHNRFTAAMTMKQFTDVAVAQGVMGEKEALSYINTFVNRSEGVYQASQKPLLFQGPIGQAIGLFQTYQFNLMQQLLRHVADGQAKNAAMTMGIQTAIFGLHGLPGFDYVNAQVIGSASGSPNNRDLFDATYGMTKKSVADWIMYGTASNVFGFLHPDLKANLYTRGDINPRFATVIPTSPGDIPIVSAFGKMYSSLKESLQKTSQGGQVWGTMLQGIEHSGINRPLAGLAQVLEAVGNPQAASFSTSNRGGVIAANDMLSLASLTRIAGARPFDEALAVDASYRMDVYKKADMKKLELLGEAVKTTVIAGNNPTSEQINGFLASYMERGGKQENFSKWMTQLTKNANTSQANVIAEHLRNPSAQSMQQIMGGGSLRDFNNSVGGGW